MAKVISLNLNETELVDRCLRNNRLAQRELYDRFAGKMMGVALRYVKGREDAEEILAMAFTKVFAKLQDFKGEGSLEGWVRNIVVREVLTFLRSHQNVFDALEEDVKGHESPEIKGSQGNADELLWLIQALPTGYRTVFNLHAVEGYNHTEIAGMLGISESTSKSQLFKARNTLQAWIAQREQTKSKP